MKEDYERMIAAKDTEIASLTASTIGPSSPTGSGIGSPVKVLKTPPRLPPSTAKVSWLSTPTFRFVDILSDRRERRKSA